MEINDYDEKGNLIYHKDHNGREIWWNEKGDIIHRKYSDGFEEWREYDERGDITHYKNSDGREEWYDGEGNIIDDIKNNYDKSFFITKAEEYYDLIANHYSSVSDLANLLNEMYNLRKGE